MTELQTAIEDFAAQLEAASKVLVLQPEKPDTDSLTASLALEEFLGGAGKEVVMYCKDEIPRYISYFAGADRVVDEFPTSFDLTILVDTGSPLQLARTLEKHQAKLTKKPFVIIDHHGNRSDMPFTVAAEVIDATSTSTCELLVKIANQLNWKLTSAVANLLVPGILADTRNLSIPTTTPENFELMATLLRAGADLEQINADYRIASAQEPELIKFRGELLTRAQFYADGKIGVVTVTPAELKQWAEVHDPSDLVIYDLQRAKGSQIGVVFRDYGGKIKVSTRANIPVAARTCRVFGGGGHDRASGCQFNDQTLEEVVAPFVAELTKQIEQYEHAPDEYLNQN